MASNNTITIRLFITPHTWVRSTQKDKWLFRIPEEDLKEKYPQQYLRKLRLERYSQYKRDLREEAKRVGFELPDDGAWIKFYIPMPRSWNKKKRRLMAFEPHCSKPDASNFHKAFEDALKAEDKNIWDYRVSKFWYDTPTQKGLIEVILPDTYVNLVELSRLQIPVHQDPVIK